MIVTKLHYQEQTVYIKLWGTRGSIPTPISSDEYRKRLIQALEFARDRWDKEPDLPAANILEGLPAEISTLIGGETTCAEIRSGDDFLIIDMGTGARRLGYELMTKGPPKDINILMTHTHWDHMQGWPFFIPGYLPSSNVNIYSNYDDMEDRFLRQQHPEHFPLQFEQMASTKKFHLFEHKDTLNIGPFKVTNHHLKHPGGASAFKIESDDKTFIFATDTEYTGTVEQVEKQIEDSRYFFEDADLLVMDAQYTMEDASHKIGWGHTPTENTIKCASSWCVKKLVLTHHEPSYDDRDIMQLFLEGARNVGDTKCALDLEIEIGVEGSVFTL